MNRFDAGAKQTPNGWTGYYRMVHHSEPRVLRDGKHVLIFPTEVEALKAAKDALLKYLNSPIVGISTMGGSKKSVAKKAADKLFRNGRTIEVERRRIGA
jgi:hypothetical protein